jgi:glutamyl endopeptidase
MECKTTAWKTMTISTDLIAIRALLSEPEGITQAWDEIARRLDVTRMADQPTRALGALLPRAVVDPRNPNDEPDPETIEGIAIAARAIARLGADAHAALSAEELEALSMLVSLIGRPAIPVAGGHMAEPPPTWRHLLADNRERIAARLPSVGRVEANGIACGTGFVVGDRLVATNRHVLRPSGAPPLIDDAGRLLPGASLVVDFDRDLDGGSRAFAVVAVAYVCGDAALDFAIVRICERGHAGELPPPPLELARTVATSGRPVYTIGYPVADPTNATPPRVLRAVFGRDLGLKRVQPGLIRHVDHTHTRLIHDCSTLGGSSGSCLIDLVSHDVCGIHVSGQYRGGNHAIATCALGRDPNLRALLALA